PFKDILPDRDLVGSKVWAGRTPGTRVISPEKLRSRRGSVFTSVEETDPPRSERAVSIKGTSSVTVSVWEAVPSGMLTSNVRFCPTTRSTLSYTTVAKPCFSIVILYDPGGNRATAKSPPLPVAVSREKTVSLLEMVIFAPGTAKPFGSQTRPCTSAVLPCASIDKAPSNVKTRRNSTATALLNTIIPLAGTTCPFSSQFRVADRVT